MGNYYERVWNWKDEEENAQAMKTRWDADATTLPPRRGRGRSGEAPDATLNLHHPPSGWQETGGGKGGIKCKKGAAMVDVVMIDAAPKQGDERENNV
jgi:hypothetical protein